jgi:putative tryptophan/tyrosine transport system substrate-binding protein
MMILRTALVAVLTLGILAAPLAVEAQPAGKVWRIGFLRGSAPPQSEIEAFRQGLRELGYVEGKNLVIEYRWAEGKEERLPSLAAELMLLNVDLILSSAPAATRAAKEASTTIPIVMVTVADPVAFGFVRSLARPGGNVTGFAFQHPELSGKRMALLKEAIPKLSRLAVLWNGANPYKAVDMKEVQAAADTFGVTLQSLPVDGPQDFERAFGAARQGRADALITLEDPFTVAHRARIVELTRTHQLPALYGRRVYVDAGGLMSYGPDPIEQYRRAAIYVDRIFKGAKPANLPVEQPTRFELVINLRAAKTLGLTFPPSLVLRADQAID